MKTVQVLAIGARVRVADGSLDGVVTGVTIREAGAHSYDVSWWCEGRRYSEWLQPCELIADNAERCEIGFQP